MGIRVGHAKMPSMYLNGPRRASSLHSGGMRSAGSVSSPRRRGGRDVADSFPPCERPSTASDPESFKKVQN